MNLLCSRTFSLVLPMGAIFALFSGYYSGFPSLENLYSPISQGFGLEDKHYYLQDTWRTWYSSLLVNILGVN